MADRSSRIGRLAGLAACAAATAVAVGGARVAAQNPSPAPGTGLRLHGLVEAVDFFSVVSPSGANGRLTVVRIAPKGATVEKGDVVLEFDRQVPLREAIDKQAEWKQLEEDIRKKQADMKLQDAVDETAIKTAENDLALAKLEATKNEVLPRIEAEKNTLNLQAAEAKLPSLKTSIALKRKAADAELEILVVRRERAARVRDRAMATADAMLVRAPIGGLIVPRTIWKQSISGPGEAEEGDEVWPGLAILDVVSTRAMRVRVKVNQVDVHRLEVGSPARITLDAYPDRSYPGRLSQISPIATRGTYSPKVRSFTALFEVDAPQGAIAPDLSAAVDVTPVEGTRASR